MNWVTTYSNTDKHNLNIQTTKITNLISPKNYPGESRQTVHAEFQWGNPFQILTYLTSILSHTTMQGKIHPALAKDSISYYCKRSLPFTQQKARYYDYHLAGCHTVKAGTNLPTIGDTLNKTQKPLTMYILYIWHSLCTQLL
jgi:hypothetical protein